MKKIYIILGTIFLFASITSCSKSFLDTEPTTSMSIGSLQKSPKGIEGVIQGIHNMFYSYSFGQFFGGGAASLNTQLDFLGNSVVNSMPGYYMGVYRWLDHRDPNGGINYKAWDFYYTVIEHCNTVLEMAKNSPNTEPKQLKTYIGEVLMIRAYCLTNLTQLFGKRYVKGGDNSSLGVIIRLKPDINPMARSSVAECYAQINKDINEGLKNLEAGIPNSDKNRITTATAYGIAARSALVQQDYSKAALYAEKAIEKFGGKAKLQSGEELLDGFNNYQATEWMWGYHQAPDQNYYYTGYGAHYSYNFEGHNKGLKLAINRSYYDKMGKKDIRRKWFVALDQGDKIPANGAHVYFEGGLKKPKWETTGQLIKYRTKSSSSSMMDNCIMRLGEMYYILAEAQARQGHLDQAAEALQTVMLSRDPEYKINKKLSQQEMANEILRNKKIDLYFEGLDFFDMKRLGQIPNRLAAGNDKYMSPMQIPNFKKRNSGANIKGLPKDANDIVWQFVIPYSEIIGNNLCKQNPL